MSLRSFQVVLTKEKHLSDYFQINIHFNGVADFDQPK